MIDKVKIEVFKLLNNDNSGHGIDHIERVLKLSLKLAEQENANKEIVALIALLHDVDDYKLFGKENADNLSNAKKIMNKAKIKMEFQKQVLDSLKCIGYRKALKGLRPKTLEGKIVSDADMLDALGANGILRVYTYCLKNGKPFFDKNIFPIEDLEELKKPQTCAESSVCHIFEKILRLKAMMLTESGKKEAINRQQIVIDFLDHLFEEEDAWEWKEYLNKFLNNNL